jgi:hypothetical protein
MAMLDLLISGPKRLWEIAPNKAVEILRNPQIYSYRVETLSGLVQCCPAENTESAIEYLLKRPAQDKEMLSRWVIQRLQRKGAPVASLMNLIRESGG